MLGGLYSEGIDLPGERLIGAAVIGMGLPVPSARLAPCAPAISGTSATASPMPAVFRACTRCCRRPGASSAPRSDRGIVLLLDDRYYDPAYVALLPDSGSCATRTSPWLPKIGGTGMQEGGKDDRAGAGAAAGPGAGAAPRKRKERRHSLPRDRRKNELYLLGSIHVGSEDMYPMGSHSGRAGGADVLALNATPQREAQAVYQEMMRCPEGDSLAAGERGDLCAGPSGGAEDGLPHGQPERAQALGRDEHAQYRGGSRHAEARGTQASAALGVEEQVARLGGGRPEVWLEDTRDELEVLDGLSPALQESLLRSTCRVILDPDSATGMDAAIDQWPEWWRTGTADAFADAYLEGMAAEPDQELAGEYHAALVTERNARMARRMAEWLEAEEEGGYFVTLGLLHLVLEGDSVPGCLEKMGYTVERILPENV